MKPAPPPIVTVRKSSIAHTTSNYVSQNNTTNKVKQQQQQNQSTLSITRFNGANRPFIFQTVNNSSSLTSSSISSPAVNGNTSTKKKYGKLDAPGSPSRSRSATKELIREFRSVLFWNSHFDLNLSMKKPVPPDDSLMCKPDFTKALKDLTIKDGETLTLSCTVQGDPEPQVNAI